MYNLELRRFRKRKISFRLKLNARFRQRRSSLISIQLILLFFSKNWIR